MKKRKFRERMIAWLLAITMIIGGCVMPDHRLVSYAAQTEERYTGGADQGNAGDSSAVNGYAADVHAKTTAAADYTVTINTSAIYPEETVQLSAVVTDSTTGAKISDAALVWSLEGNPPPAVLTSDGKLTVAKGTAAGTKLTVKAAYTDAQTQSEYSGTLELTTSERQTATVTFNVKDSHNSNSIANAKIILTQSTNPLNQEVTAVGNGNGQYTATVYTGISYTVEVEAQNYKQSTSKLTMNPGMGVQKIELTTSRTAADIQINVPSGEFYAGDTVTLSVQLPDEWNGETVTWSSDKGTITQDGQLTFDGFGAVNVTASCHGVTSNEAVIVFKPINDKTQVEVKVYKDKDHKTEISDPDNKDEVYPNETVYVGAKVTYKGGLPSSDGTMTFKVEKKTSDGKYAEVYTSEQPVAVNKADGLASVEVPADKLLTAGAYRVTAEYKGVAPGWNDKVAATSNQATFAITPKGGQKVSFDEGIPAEYVYKTDEISVGFSGSMATNDENKYEITVESEGNVFVPESVKLKGISVSETADKNGLYKVEGTVAFILNNVGEDAKIKITLKDHQDANQQVYADAVAEYKFKVKPKPLTISGITFADKTYDSTSDIQLESVSLNGIEVPDRGKVQVDIGEMQNNGSGSKVFHLTGSDATDATDEGYPLSLEEKDPKLELIGDSAGKYTLDTTGHENYKAKIKKRLIGINKEALKLEQAYWSDIYTKYDGDLEKDIYNTALNEAAFEKREQLYTNIVESEKQEILNQLRDYHPKFEADANKFSGTDKDSYDIYAWNPKAKNPLTNYEFSFENDPIKAGTLTIVAADVIETDFTVVGDNALQKDAKSFYVRSRSDADASVISCVNEEGSVKYNAVEFLDKLGKDDEDTYFNPSKKDAVWPETNGKIAFILEKVEDGLIVASTKPYVMNFTSDGGVQSQITVKANNAQNGITFGKVLETLTFGLFGNKDNTTAEITYSDKPSDEQSGVKERYYAVVGYDEWQKNVNYEKALKTFTDWTPVDSDTKINFEDGRQLVLSKVVDNVGNIQYVMSNGIVVDSVKPDTIKAEITNPSEDDVYNKDVNINVSVSDFINDETAYSGIASVDYKVEISHDNVITDETKWDIYTEKTNLSKETPPTDIENADVLKSQASYSGIITVSPKNQKCSTDPGVKNRMRVTIWATDYAGNVTEEKTVDFDFDTTAPKLEISFDGEAVNEKYFNKDRTVTVKVTEAYFDAEGVDCTTTGADNIQPWKPVGDNVYEAKYVYNRDGDWEFGMKVTDMAGNVSNMADSFGGEDNVPANYKKFTIDKTAPEITDIHYYMYQGENVIEITPGKAEAERFYGNAKIYAVLTLKEHNFDADDKTGAKESGLELDITANDKGGNYAEPTHQFAEDNGDVHTLRVDFNGDANYIFDMQYTDKAGNTLEKDYVAEYFTVDTKEPSANISVLGKTWDKILEVITFGLFSNKNETVEISNVFDQTAGVAAVQYYKSHDAMTVGQLDNAAWTNGSTLTLGPNQQAIVYGKITDKSGNYTYISTNGFVLDNMIDAPQIDIVVPKPLNEIYNSDVDAKIKVVDPDPTGNHDYAGLQSVYYEIRNNGAVTQSGNLNVQAGEARQQSVEDIIRISAQKNNSNNIQIYVKAVDNAGNSAEKTLDLKIDITKPNISVTFDNNAPLNQKYYKATRTATIVIKERNFDPNNVQINITNMHGTKAQISGWSSSANQGVSDEAVHTARIVFAADGDYKFTVDCTDLALNKAANPYTSEEFTIDKTIPTINVSYDNNNALNGSFYKAGRTATITIKEHNFRAGDVKVTTTAALSGKGVSAPSVSGWSSSGDNHTATVRFNSDADYTLDIAYADLAGNAAADYAQDKFTVDLTTPEIEITGVKNKSANNGTVAPEIKVTDTNFIASGVKLSLTGVNKGKLSADAMVTKAALGSGQVITFRNFGKDMDDIYTLTATVTDKSGNETKKSITFSVNRNGSTYVLSDDLKQLLETGFTNSPKDIVIEEINVDTLEFIELTYSKDGKVVKLKEGTDYTVKSEGGSNQWKKYIYTIKASCFEEEGAYAINIYSEDRAKNTSTNRIKEKSIEFVVDKTPPTMVISNIEDRGRYKEDRHTFTLSVKDNTTLSYVELYLDGKLAHTYKGDELIAENGTISINVENKGEYQTVRLIAYDEAGNPTEPMEYSVLVTSSWWIQFYMNTPLFVGSIIGLAAVIGLVILIIVKRKKKNAQ